MRTFPARELEKRRQDRVRHALPGTMQLIGLIWSVRVLSGFKSNLFVFMVTHSAPLLVDHLLAGELILSRISLAESN